MPLCKLEFGLGFKYVIANGNMNNLLECLNRREAVYYQTEPEPQHSFNKTFAHLQNLLVSLLPAELVVPFHCPPQRWALNSLTGKRNWQTKELPRFAAETFLRNYRLWLVDLLAVLSFHLRTSPQIGSDLLHGPSGLLCYKTFLKEKQQQS